MRRPGLERRTPLYPLGASTALVDVISRRVALSAAGAYKCLELASQMLLLRFRIQLPLRLPNLGEIGKHLVQGACGRLYRSDGLLAGNLHLRRQLLELDRDVVNGPKLGWEPAAVDDL